MEKPQKSWVYTVLSVAGLCCLIMAASVGASVNDVEPIAYIGHGAFFDSQGKQIEVTPEFLGRAQNWYEQRILKKMTAEGRGKYQSTRSQLSTALKLNTQDRVLVDQTALLAAISTEKYPINARTLGKLFALQSKLIAVQEKSSAGGLLFFQKFSPSVDLRLRVEQFSIGEEVSPPVAGGVGAGKNYVDACRAAGVPVPAPIGQMDAPGVPGWKVGGQLPGKATFIVGTNAEIRTYEDSNGFCYALPRLLDDKKTTIQLDGVICFNKTTLKACFWDNQMNKKTFFYEPGTKIPFGYADLAVNADGLYQSGGEDIAGGAGGVCTDCHAGENPFIVHPNLDMGNGQTWGALQKSLPAFGADRYVPIVTQEWPQNNASEDESNIPGYCVGCHSKDGSAGRLPKMSTVSGYCGILSDAVKKTMPPRAPGSFQDSPEIQALKKLCEVNTSSLL